MLPHAVPWQQFSTSHCKLRGRVSLLSITKLSFKKLPNGSTKKRKYRERLLHLLCGCYMEPRSMLQDVAGEDPPTEKSETPARVDYRQPLWAHHRMELMTLIVGSLFWCDWKENMSNALSIIRSERFKACLLIYFPLHETIFSDALK